jgi:hypothetical protein
MKSLAQELVVWSEDARKDSEAKFERAKKSMEAFQAIKQIAAGKRNVIYANAPMTIGCAVQDMHEWALWEIGLMMYHDGKFGAVLHLHNGLLKLGVVGSVPVL